MNTSKTNIPSSTLSDQLLAMLPSQLPQELRELNLRELLGMTLSTLSEAERKVYLSSHPEDKGNGSYARSLQLGSMPVQMSVPRTRSAEFRPSLLPSRYSRGYPQEMQSLVMGLLSSCRSIEAAKQSLQRMGLSASQEHLDEVAQEFIQAMQLRNQAPIAPDLFALFIDAKYVELREQDRIRPCTLYTVIGLEKTGQKRILTCYHTLGKENLDDWKKVLTSLLERGLRRVLILVQDDFSGLLPISKSLFPQTDIQLCTVHLQRNAQAHLGKEDGKVFVDRLRHIKTCCSKEQASALFQTLCDDFKPKAVHFIEHIQKRKEHYLHFIDYPTAIRKTLSTTNAVETVNTQLERMRINNGGYFHGQNVLLLKLGITLDYLENGKWKNPAASSRAALHELNLLFNKKFESESL